MSQQIQLITMRCSPVRRVVRDDGQRMLTETTPPTAPPRARAMDGDISKLRRDCAAAIPHHIPSRRAWSLAHSQRLKRSPIPIAPSPSRVSVVSNVSIGSARSFRSRFLPSMTMTDVEVTREGFGFATPKNKGTKPTEESLKKPAWSHTPYVKDKQEGVVVRYLRKLLGMKTPKTRCSGLSDRDLVYHLKLHSAFVPRTTALAVTLRNKAMRFMAEFDFGCTTLEEAYNMVMNSVAEALVVDKMEITVAKRLADDKKVMDEMQPFFSQGRFRNQGLLRAV